VWLSTERRNASPSCSTIRLGTQSNVIYWSTPWGPALNETYLPQNLKDVGYSTAMFGKWCARPAAWGRIRLSLTHLFVFLFVCETPVRGGVENIEARSG
jgi:hypothetical protein